MIVALGVLFDKQLEASVRQGPNLCSYWRVAWFIAGGVDRLFTFSVSADLIRR